MAKSYLDSPMYQRMLAQTLQGNSRPQYPMEAGANALAQILSAYTLKQYGEKQDQRESASNQALADALAPPEYGATGRNAVQASAPLTFEGIAPRYPGSTGPAAASPQQTTINAGLPDYADANAGRNAQLAAYLNSGGSRAPLDKLALSKMGFGEAAEYDTTPRTGVNPTTKQRELFIMDKQGNQKWLGTAPETKMEIAGNNVVDPYNTPAGTRLPDTKSDARMAQDLRVANAGRATTQVNVGPTGIDYGKPDAGLVWQRDPKTNQVVLDNRGAPIAIPYQGGKPYIEMQDNQTADAMRKTQQALESDVVVQDVGRLLDLGKKNTITGMVGTALKSVPGTPQNNARALISTIEANLAFGKLQKMREASPTGGALGAVTAPELNLLKSALANLDQSQSDDQFRANAKRVRDTYIDTVHGKGTAKRLFPDDEPAGGSGKAGTSKGVKWRVLD